MKQNSGWMLSAMTAAFFCMVASSASAVQSAKRGHIGLPQDWSNRHVVYANPDTPAEAASNGHMAQWLHKARDPRFLAAMMRKIQAPIVSDSLSTLARMRRPPPKKSSLHRDWSNVLGGGPDALGGVGTPGVYPAKFSFDINAAPNCASDFVVYPTATAGATSSGTVETLTSAFTGNPANGETIIIGTAGTVTAPATARTITLTASATLNTGLNFQIGGTTAITATNLAAAVHRWSATTGIDATSSGANVTYAHISTSNTVTIPISDNLSNYLVGAGSDGTGTAGQPTLVAFNNVYSSCGGTVPNVYWSYNTGNGVVTRTSPVLSYYDNGQQVAFVQSAGGVAQLVLLKWSSASAGTIEAPTAPTSVAAASYRACAAPCMTVMPFNGGSDDSFSSPFVDYSGDVLWVGDNSGTLHKFTGTFVGTPAEVTSGGFPVTVSAGNALSSPVYDVTGAQAYVGSASGGAGSGGMLHRVDTATGAVASSAKLAIDNSTGLRASPILDSSAGRVYAFVYDDGTIGNGATCVVSSPPNGCRSVVQFVTGFAGGNAGISVLVGRGDSTANTMYDGTFDDAYYSNSVPTGAFYICGGQPTKSLRPTLWKIPITNNVMGAPVQGGQVADSQDPTIQCSPISEVKNGSNDYLYVSVSLDGIQTGCNDVKGGLFGGCLYMFNLNNLDGANGTTWGTSNTARAGLFVPGGTSGIVIDNTSAVTGASQIYFSSLGTDCDLTTAGLQLCGNAFQASQALLQ